MRDGYVLLNCLSTILQLSPLAQQPIRFDTGARIFRIDAAHTTYAFGIVAEGRLQNIYWGGSIMPADPFTGIAK